MADETPVALPPAAPAKELRLAPEVEIELLRKAHAVLQDFPIQGRFASLWTQVLDALGAVANSLITKNDDLLKSPKKED